MARVSLGKMGNWVWETVDIKRVFVLCKNCEGKGLLKKGDKVVKCQRCGGTGVR
jgi:DnaJ-class molecular chaperone